jgi:integrase
LVAVFCGLRASELRGLRWADVDFDARQINVTQRADASHKIGKLKSKAAYRSLRLSAVLNALREWKLLCPNDDLGLVFPNGIGKVESYANLIDRGFGPIQGDGVGFATESYAASALYTTLASLSGALWRIRRPSYFPAQN